VLFVGGFGRSGSTLVELLLGQAPDVAALGEVVHLWRRGVQRDELCGCGESFHACPFWTAVGARAFGGWDALDLERVLALQAAVDRQRMAPVVLAPMTPSLADRVHAYAGYYREVYEAAAATAGTPVVVDSSKNPSLAAVLAREPAIDLRVLHLVRDSRGVAHSWSKEVRRPEVVTETSLMPRYSAAISSGYWLGQNALVHLLPARRVPVLRMRYEDLVDDAPAAIRAVRTFVGLDPASSPPPDAPGPQHSVAGNPMRFSTGPLTLRRDERWREQMPVREQRLVTALTAPLAARYGYLGRGHR
jgi:hypothetical protein